MELTTETPTEEPYCQKDDQIMLDEGLLRLKEIHREVLQLRYYLDLDYQTIAELLKIPIGTLKSRISIGLDKLKQSLGGEWL